MFPKKGTKGWLGGGILFCFSMSLGALLAWPAESQTLPALEAGIRDDSTLTPLRNVVDDAVLMRAARHVGRLELTRVDGTSDHCSAVILSGRYVGAYQ